jgi:hypothetical protein
LNVALTFQPAFAGNKVVYLYAATPTANTGWQTGWTWNVQ